MRLVSPPHVVLSILLAGLFCLAIREESIYVSAESLSSASQAKTKSSPKPTPTPKTTAQSKNTSSAKTKSTSTPTSASKPANSTAAAGATPTGLSSREKQVLDEINSVRANPTGFIKALEEFKKHFRGKELHFPNGSRLLTNEGVAALDDAIKFLRTVKPVAPLEVRKGLNDAAKLHVADMVATGIDGHRGSNGSKPDDRINLYGRWSQSVGENIVYDSQDPRTDVILMAIDDGTANRGHRKNLFKEDFRVVGIAAGKRPKSSEIVVITFAGNFSEARKQ